MTDMVKPGEAPSSTGLRKSQCSELERSENTSTDSRAQAQVPASRPILGGDPGISGALAFLYDDGSIHAEDVPVVDGAIDVDALVRLVRHHAPRLAVIEKAQSMPRQGVSSTFKYGVAFGALCAVVAVCEVPMHLVSPRRWKGFYGLDADKERSRGLAIRLWPGVGLFERKRDERRAEAALLAKYGADVIDRARR